MKKSIDVGKMKFVRNIWILALLIFVAFTFLVNCTPVDGPLKRCRREISDCPDGCTATKDDDGCHDCHCGVPYYRAPRRYCRKSKCPIACGFKKNAMGCPTCFCDLNSYYRKPLDILKYRPTLKQPLAMAAEAKYREKLDETPLNAILN